MKFQAIDLLNGRSRSAGIPKRVLLVPSTLLLTIFLVSLISRSSKTLSPEVDTSNSHALLPSIDTSSSNSTEEKSCDVFLGEWVSYPGGPRYYDETCKLLLDQQNCFKNGRPDREFLNWRWKPYECDLPLFDATQFLKLVRGKSMAFVGDSVGRNHMLSLLCLLSTVASPEKLSSRYEPLSPYAKYESSQWFYADYNFTLGMFFSPFLVRSILSDPNGFSWNSRVNVYLDEADEEWTTRIQTFDHVILSAAQWFWRQMVFYEKGQVVGCFGCKNENITDLPNTYGLRKVFRTALRTLNELKGYNGVTFLRTYSPTHFENGEFNTGGSCPRRKPFAKGERRLEGYPLEAYLTQVEEFRTAEKEGRKKGLQFRLLETTEAMMLRPDGHPNHYGRMKNKNVKVVDCVHWCCPGPIDTWNEFLLHFMKLGTQTSSS
ncbi:hypothetical protein L6164_006554 [Bauhinia variegata]|uniref:Uncharacterized protein n=1 Tax=Bauhinia variegata TaxID=167791 RepID=A0ACB9PU82_BAUVA|nr:hypothetical protein L6164_006554 [Bauhinia variegata]